MSERSEALARLLSSAGYRIAPHPLEPGTTLVIGEGERFVVREATGEGWTEALLAAIAPSRLARGAVMEVLDRMLAEGSALEAALGPTPPPPRSKRSSPAAREPYLAEVRRIASAIEVRHARLAQSSPRLIVAEVAVWVAEARAAQERSGDDRVVRDAVHVVVQRLAQLAHDFWPGSIRILRRDSAPADVGEGIGTWAGAAVSARAELGRLREELRGRGFDELGFADGAWLEPRPRSPYTLLQEAEAALSRDDPSDDDGGVAVLEEAAAKLRWIRGGVPPLRWGAAMGRLRRAAVELGERGSSLRAYLHPSYSPGEPWRDLFEVEPVDDAANLTHAADITAELADLLIDERPSAELDEVGVIAWVARASRHLDSASLACFLAPAQRTLAEVDLDAIGEPSVARALREVRERLEAAEAGGGAPPSGPEVLGADAAPDLQFLRDFLRVRARGQRVLLVGDVEATTPWAQILQDLAFEVVEREPTGFGPPQRGEYALMVTAMTAKPGEVLPPVRQAARSAGLEHVDAMGVPVVAVVVAIARVLLRDVPG